mgnify:CR=1 FL=1
MGVVVDFEDSGKRKASIKGLTDLVQADLERVNKTIIEHMQSPVALIPQLAGHLIAAGGKRLRPMLTLGAAYPAGGLRRVHPHGHPAA